MNEAEALQSLTIRYLIPADTAKRLLLASQDGHTRTYESRVTIRCIYSNGQSSQYVIR